MPSNSDPDTFGRGWPDGQHGVQVDVRLDQRRRDQAAVQVDDLGGGLAGGHGHDPAAGDAQVGDVIPAGQPGIAQDEVDHGAIIPGNRSPVGPGHGTPGMEE